MHRAFLGLVALAVAACDGPPSAGDGWKVVAELSDGLAAKFVEVGPDKLQNIATYQQAIAHLCKQKPICVIGFFATGDRIPRSQDSRSFFGAGGWNDYSPIAVWWSNTNSGMANFTKWDCERAGAANAPLDALCGPNVRATYDAILAVAGRVGTAEACRWPRNSYAQIATDHIASIADAERRKQFQNAYESFYASSQKGPNNPEDCKRLRARIEEDSKQAVNLLIQVRGK